MNREIKFRGKRIDTGELIYGSYRYYHQIVGITEVNKHFIMQEHEIAGHQVLFETIGQYTGLKDNNGVEIYEGDILHCHEYDSRECFKNIIQTFKNAVVGFYSGSFYYFPKGNMNQPHQLLMYAYRPIVIGNIFENPELIK